MRLRRRLRRLRGSGPDSGRFGRRPPGGSSPPPPPGRVRAGATAVPDRPPLRIAEVLAAGATRVAVPPRPSPSTRVGRPLSWVSRRGSRADSRPSGGVTVPTAPRRAAGAATAAPVATVGASAGARWGWSVGSAWWVGFCDGGTGRQPGGRPSPGGRWCPPGPGGPGGRPPWGGRPGPGGGPGGPGGGPCWGGGPGGRPGGGPWRSPREPDPAGGAGGVPRSGAGARPPPRSVRRSSSTDRLPVPGGSLVSPVGVPVGPGSAGVRGRRSGAAGGPLPTRRRFPGRMTVRGGSTGTTGRPPRHAR